MWVHATRACVSVVFSYFLFLIQYHFILKRTPVMGKVPVPVLLLFS